MIPITLVGASGYVGGELLRLLHAHPALRLTRLVTTQEHNFDHLYPNLRSLVTGSFERVDTAAIDADSEATVLAVPHGTAAELAGRLDCRVLDCSGDLRLTDLQLRSKHYCDSPLQAVYGLPELHRAQLSGARRVANPGCYPTASILALRPLIESGLVAGPAIVDAKSGVSGAGRGATETTHFCHVNENLRAYNLGIHRHQPEIEQELGGHPVYFAPHLVPMTRGILATCYAPLREDPGDLAELYRRAYQDEPFVRVLPGDTLPQTRATYASNFCDLAVRYDRERRLAVVVAALDNLVKGAAGQAIQNLNLMLGRPETEGLLHPGILV